MKRDRLPSGVLLLLQQQSWVLQEPTENKATSQNCEVKAAEGSVSICLISILNATQITEG